MYPIFSRRPQAWLAASALAWLAPCMAAPTNDVPGAGDTALITRYQGSRLAAWQDDGFAQVSLPSTYDVQNSQWIKPQVVEGERQRRVYVAPSGRKALEVQRNYEQALTAAGATRLLSCGSDDFRRCRSALGKIEGDHTSWLSDGSFRAKDDSAFNVINRSTTDFHALFKLQRNGRTYWISLYTTEGASEGTGTVVDIISPKAMDAGKVSVANADAIGQGLKAEGRMAVYGLSFDTGKAEIRPESQPQLAEMAKLLKAQPALKVFIVGHTDNLGQVDANLSLSQRRAEAIVAALAKDFGIAANRLQARGVANFAPVASNAAEEGRARNRRVELVVQ